jgi:hypothetical protein
MSITSALLMAWIVFNIGFAAGGMWATRDNRDPWYY